MIIRVHPSNLFTATKIHPTWPSALISSLILRPSESSAVPNIHGSRCTNCTAEELARRLLDPIPEEATGVLEMIAKNPEERQHYEDRLKAERDAWARTEQAKLDGLEMGELVGRIELLCQLLGQALPRRSTA